MSTDTTVSRLAEWNMRTAEIRRRLCPHTSVQGTAVRWCGQCGSTLPPVDHETHAPLRGAR